MSTLAVPQRGTQVGLGLRNGSRCCSQEFPDRWRKPITLLHMIGADKETTKRLLLEIGARGTEDQQELWCLIEYHPSEKQ